MYRSVILALFFLVILTGCSIKVKELGGPVKSKQLTDGIYRGEYKKGPVSVALDVTIQNQKIADIQIIKHDCWKGKKAVPTIPEAIIKHQSTQVEAVSGATVSSQVIMNAVQMAIDKANYSSPN